MSGSIKIGGQFPPSIGGVKTLAAGSNIAITNPTGPTSTIAVAPLAPSSLFGNVGTVSGPATAVAINSSNLSLTTDGTLQISTGPIINVTTSAPVVLNANTAMPAAPTGTLLQIVGKDATAGRLLFDAFAQNPQVAGRRSQGSEAVPTAVTSGNALMQLAGFGYGATGYGATPRAILALQASQTWTDVATGTQMAFQVAANGGTVVATAMTLQNSGDLTIGTAADVANGGKLQVVGGALLDIVNLGTAVSLPNIRQGAGVPAITAPSGSMYLRNDGSAGARLYINQDGVSSWAAVALV